MRPFHIALVVLAALVLSGGLLLSASAGTPPDTDTIRIWDNCDPPTFNATFGAGTCLPGEHGTEKFSIFIGEVVADRVFVGNDGAITANWWSGQDRSKE